LLQVSIMSRAWRFENPLGQCCRKFNAG
jgi:hypothetical protein